MRSVSALIVPETPVRSRLGARRIGTGELGSSVGFDRFSIKQKNFSRVALLRAAPLSDTGPLCFLLSPLPPEEGRRSKHPRPPGACHIWKVATGARTARRHKQVALVPDVRGNTTVRVLVHIYNDVCLETRSCAVVKHAAVVTKEAPGRFFAETWPKKRKKKKKKYK